MQVVIERHKTGNRLIIRGMETLVAGAGDEGRPLLARKWKRGVYDEAVTNLMTSDNHYFAPIVRQIRTRQGLVHDVHAKKGIKELYGKHEGKPVIIVACGPSMTKALPVVRELHDKYGHVVIGTNICLQHGYADVIDYYMMLCWLTQPWWWWGIDTAKLKCITSFHTPMEVIRDFPDRYYFDDHFMDVTIDTPEERKRFGTLDGGLSVSYSALHMAFKLGASRIIYVGMDLSYTGGNDHENDPLNFDKAMSRQVFIERDIFGNAVLTDRHMVQQRDLIRGQCMLLEEVGIPIINITNAGILNLGYCISPERYLEEARSEVEYTIARRPSCSPSETYIVQSPAS